MKKGAKPTYISLKSLAERWDCARSSASRIVNREGMRKTFFDNKDKAMVRVFLEDVEAFEKINTTRGA